jgi:hypothetical protein
MCLSSELRFFRGLCMGLIGLATRARVTCEVTMVSQGGNPERSHIILYGSL